jgi:hypothetical protein
MKAIVIALFIFAVVVSISQAALSSPDFKELKPWSSSSNVDTKSIEAKLSEALHGLSTMQKSSSDKSAINLSAINLTAANSTETNTTEINSTAINASAKDEASSETEGGSGAVGAVSFSGNSSVSPQEVGSNSKASFNGFWGMEASQKGTGKNGISSRTFLSGGFEVDKTVKFQDRGY